MLLRLGIQLVTSRHSANFDPSLFRGITRHQLIQRRLHCQLFLAKRTRQLIDDSWLVRRIDDRF